jgi:hypothetical protein
MRAGHYGAARGLAESRERFRRAAVGRPSKIAVEPRAERRAMIALVAVFALLVQVLVPGIAAAAPSASGEQVICTGHGLASVKLGDPSPAKGSAASPCEHCVCPPLAAQPPAMTEPTAAVAYAAEARPEAAAADVPPPARAPPRPPGQGPPSFHA